jgi:hypothetical protein
MCLRQSTKNASAENEASDCHERRWLSFCPLAGGERREEASEARDVFNLRPQKNEYQSFSASCADATSRFYRRTV